MPFELNTYGKGRSSWLRLVAAMALSVTSTLSIATGPTARAGQGRAKAVVGQTRYNFGEVFAGEQLVHVFSILNEGTAPLTLLDKARDTEGKSNRDEGSLSRIVYARATLPPVRGVAAMALAPIAREPVPT
jgi:hypothetical protein